MESEAAVRNRFIVTPSGSPTYSRSSSDGRKSGAASTVDIAMETIPERDQNGGRMSTEDSFVGGLGRFYLMSMNSY